MMPAAASTPTTTFDTRALRNALGRFATGVTIVTCLDAQGQPMGLTANSFSALSLDPPMVLWALRCSSLSLAAFTAAPGFVVNVLAEDQVDLSRHFASPLDSKFVHGVWTAGAHGLPLLQGCAAVFQCDLVSHQVAGDHVLFIGRVTCISEAPVPPLLFQAGHYRMLGEVL